eukprot:6215455-Pyramimonas_sp.AAC.1
MAFRFGSICLRLPIWIPIGFLFPNEALPACRFPSSRLLPTRLPNSSEPIHWSPVRRLDAILGSPALQWLAS